MDRELAAELEACRVCDPTLEDAPRVRSALALRQLIDHDVVVVSIRGRRQINVSPDAPAAARAEGLKDVPVMRKLAHELRDFGGTVMLITNPVEAMCHVWEDTIEARGASVVGLGLSLDAARAEGLLRRRLSGVGRASNQSLGLVAVGGHALGPVLVAPASTQGRFQQALDTLGTTAEQLVWECRTSVMRRMHEFRRTSIEPARVFSRDITRMQQSEAINVSWSVFGPSGESVGGLVRRQNGRLVPCAVQPGDAESNRRAVVEFHAQLAGVVSQAP
ncbi:MAG: hypothetical protein AAGI53_16010 [Planctomycetota bacterium]